MACVTRGVGSTGRSMTAGFATDGGMLLRISNASVSSCVTLSTVVEAMLLCVLLAVVVAVPPESLPTEMLFAEATWPVLLIALAAVTDLVASGSRSTWAASAAGFDVSAAGDYQ